MWKKIEMNFCRVLQFSKRQYMCKGKTHCFLRKKDLLYKL